MGLFQNVQTQSQPLELLTAVVRDKALNPLSGVAVEFFVKTGQAYFAPGEGVMIAAMNGKTGQKITLKTDKNGLVAVRPYIGEEEGSLGQYTAMGYAPLSEAGSQLITEAGSGISKAGWGGVRGGRKVVIEAVDVWKKQ